MRFLVCIMLLAMTCAAEAQEKALVVGKALAEQVVPLQDCLKMAIDDAKPSSNEDARIIATSACAEIASDVRIKLIETHKHFADLPPRTYGDPEKATDQAIGLVRAKAYWDFTGELKRVEERIKENAEKTKERIFRNYRKGDP
jgi:hypothetical protein